MRHTFRLGLVLLGVLALATAAYSFSLRTTMEKLLGSLYSSAIESAYDLEGDPLANDYLERVARPIANATGNTDFRFRFRIVDDSEVNAFALPGGYIYVNRGLLESANRTDELAGVIGHELAHVTQHHSWDTLKKSIFADLLLSQLDINDNATALIVGLGAQLVFLSYSRDHEREADKMGARFTLRGGFDPDGLTGFMATLLELNDDEPSRLERLLSTHPDTRSRLEGLLKRNPAELGSPGQYVKLADLQYNRGLIYTALRNYEKALQVDPSDLRAKAGLLRAAYVVGEESPTAYGPGNFAQDPEAADWERMFAVLAPLPGVQSPPQLVETLIAKADTATAAALREGSQTLPTTTGLVSSLMELPEFEEFAFHANELLGEDEIKGSAFARETLGAVAESIQTLRSMASGLSKLQTDSTRQLDTSDSLLERAQALALAGKLPEGYLEALTEDLEQAAMETSEATAAITPAAKSLAKAGKTLRMAAQALSRADKDELVKYGTEASLARELNREVLEELSDAREQLEAGLDKLYVARARQAQWTLSLSTTPATARERAMAARLSAWTLNIPLADVVRAMEQNPDMGEVFLALAGGRSGRRNAETVVAEGTRGFRAQRLRDFGASPKMVAIISGIAARELTTELQAPQS